jgi:hypothetical protein
MQTSNDRTSNVFDFWHFRSLRGWRNAQAVVTLSQREYERHLEAQMLRVTVANDDDPNGRRFSPPVGVRIHFKKRRAAFRNIEVLESGHVVARADARWPNT